MNDEKNPDSMQTVFYKIDAKTLQLKWTEIEVRKHVIPQMQNENNADNEALEDDLPPLEEEPVPVRAKVQNKTTFTDRKAPSPEPLSTDENSA